MSDAAQPLRGVVHGRLIELETPLDLPDGQQIEVSLRPWTSHAEAIRQTSGAWIDDAESLDALLIELRGLRRMDRVDPAPR